MLNDILKEFLNIDGVKAAAIVGKDGFVIANTDSDNFNVDALGAMVATTVRTSETLGHEFNLGNLEQYLTEFADGKVVMAKVMDDILAIVTDSSAIIGSVRYAIKKAMPQMTETL